MVVAPLDGVGAAAVLGVAAAGTAVVVFVLEGFDAAGVGLLVVAGVPAGASVVVGPTADAVSVGTAPSVPPHPATTAAAARSTGAMAVASLNLARWCSPCAGRDARGAAPDAPG